MRCRHSRGARTGCVSVAVALGIGLPALPGIAEVREEVRNFVREDGVVVIFSVEGREVAAPRLRERGQVDRFASTDLEIVIDRFANLENLDPALIDAVIRVESAYNRDAVSRKGARGLMQLMPRTARELGVEDSFDIVENVRGGTRYLRSMLDRFDGDLELGLAGYNVGPSAVERFGGVPPLEETRSYIRRVLAAYRDRAVSVGSTARGGTRGARSGWRDAGDAEPLNQVRIERGHGDEIVIVAGAE